MRLGLDPERHSQKMQMISAQEIEAVLDWEGVLQALHDAHLGPRRWEIATSSAMPTMGCSAAA
jgi:hypothetical protein